MSREPRPTFDPEYIRDISEMAYRLRLEQDCEGNVARMIEKDEDEGQMLRNRSGAYDPLTRAYLKVLGFEPGVPLPQLGCGYPNCRDPNCTYGKGPNRDPLSRPHREAP